MTNQIELNVVIDDQQIVVTGGSTSFVNMGLMPEHCPNDLMVKRETIMKLAKSKGIKISFKAKTKKEIQDLAPTYKSNYERYYATFSLLRALWQTKVSKGISVKHGDDKELGNIIAINRKVESMFGSNTPLSDLHAVAVRLERLYKEIKNNNDLVQIII